ncbi:MAG TPA: hypothetical protein VN631_16285 [Negativicutes bacterium]|nr:hypothetical protein [Negativicutes bacterium]
MDNKKQKNSSASVKPEPLKPVRKKRRFLLWFFLLLVGGVAGVALYYRLIPMGAEMEAKVEPYLLQAESTMKASESYVAKLDPYIEKAKIWKSKEEEPASGTPKTNFPLVELDDKKNAVTPPVAPMPGAPAAPAAPATSTTILGPSAVASAAAATPAAGTATKPPAVPMSAETAKVYSKLSKLYSAMKAEEAVAVFNSLEDEQVIIILSRMEEDAAAKVLSVFEPKRAARLTQAMIKRK